MPGVYTLNSTVDTPNMKIPSIGLGTWQATEEELDLALTTAIEAGYRHIDTAYVYLNESAIGKTLEKLISTGKVKREELFIVTKLPNIANRPEYVETYIKKSLEALRVTYVDLYLVHTPVALMHGEDLLPRDENGALKLDLEVDHLELWKAMEKQVDAGRAKAIGVSNFNLRQLKRVYENSRIKPSCNQVELHVYLQQKELVDYCKKNGIAIVAYGALGSSALPDFNKKFGLPVEREFYKLMDDPVVNEIAKKHGKTSSQVLLRFLVELGVSVIPKSTNPKRIQQNIDLFNFELTKEEFERLAALDKGEEGRQFNDGIFKLMAPHPEYPFK